MSTCDYELRSGKCQMEQTHKGRHSTVTFYCESCGKIRRGTPHSQSFVRLGDGTIDDIFDFCFMCCNESTYS